MQILARLSIPFTTVKNACAQCKNSLRNENHDFDDSNQIWPLGARARCGKRLKADETLSKLDKLLFVNQALL